MIECEKVTSCRPHIEARKSLALAFTEFVNLTCMAGTPVSPLKSIFPQPQPTIAAAIASN